ncbi:MAG: winged helix-turn-helix domain-containing protein, partial [Oligoflexales bacterium]
PKSGRPTYLKRELEASLVERIQQGPVEHDDVSVLTAKYIRKIIEEEYGTTYSVSGTEKLLKRLNFSKGKPRPHHEKHDEEAIKRWKESTLPNFVKFTADQHPKKNFKFGIRMKADLEKKPG